MALRNDDIRPAGIQRGGLPVLFRQHAGVRLRLNANRMFHSLSRLSFVAAPGSGQRVSALVPGSTASHPQSRSAVRRQ